MSELRGRRRFLAPLARQPENAYRGHDASRQADRGARIRAMNGTTRPSTLRSPRTHRIALGSKSGRSFTLAARTKVAGLHDIRARSAQSPDDAGRELAWFPASVRNVARQVRTLAFTAWFQA